MRRFLVIGLLIIQIPLFILVSRSIVNVTLLQLRYQLTRERLLNYELSSRVLESRFRRELAERNNVSNEIKMNVLESSILNFDTQSEQMELTPTQILGLWIVNVVRSASFKHILSLDEDQERLLMLQYAFYLERNRRYDKSSEKYEELEDIIKGQPEDHGFVLLHGGYSLAMLGETDKAIEKLNQVMDRYDGTHYATTASLLLTLLVEGEEEKKRIEQEFKEEKDRAVAFFESGQYAEAVKRFEALDEAEKKDLKKEDQFVLSRSYEETGRIKNAVDGYVELVKQKENEDIAKEANRRLLMIGNFYGGGEEMSKFAEQNAKKLGDEEVVQEVKEGVELQLKPVIIEKIEKKAAAETGQEEAVDVAKLEEIREELQASFQIEENTMEEIKLEIQETPEEVIPKKGVPEVAIPKEKIPEVAIKIEPKKPEIGPSPRLVIEFVDGRKIYSKSLSWADGSVILKSGEYNITIPDTMVGQVGMDPASGDIKSYNIGFKLTDGKVVRGLELKKEGGEFVIINEDGEQTAVTVEELREAESVPLQ